MAANGYRLVIGNKNWSSWSLRPWLAMRHFGLPFEEINVRLRLPESKAEITKYSPSGLVPLLLDGDLAIWDSLAILEYLADAHPDRGIWPADRQARALARCVSAEMHSGFMPLRRNCSMEVLATHRLDPVPEDVEADIRRIVGLWKECRAKFSAGGPVPIRRLLGCGRDVCASRLPLPHLRAGSRPLRRRRDGVHLRGRSLRHAGDGRVDSRRPRASCRGGIGFRVLKRWLARVNRLLRSVSQPDVQGRQRFRGLRRVCDPNRSGRPQWRSFLTGTRHHRVRFGWRLRWPRSPPR